MTGNKKTAVITLTKGGINLGQQLLKQYPDFKLYVPSKFRGCEDKPGDRIYYYDTSLKELISRIFTNHHNLIFIMSLGIVVRIITPYLESKKKDPAVVTIDENGQNVISTLSGHLGGANSLTKELADFLDTNPVITTATDCQGKPAIDLLAKKMNCVIKPFSNLKLANSAIVNDNRLNIFTNYNIPLSETKNIKIHPLSQLGPELLETGFPVIISNKRYTIDREYLQLIPRNITIGIGCRRGVSFTKINKAITRALEITNLREASIKSLATIDLKVDEAGILTYLENKKLKIDIIARDQIRKEEANLKGISRSEFVEKTVGVPGVCEPAALISSNNGKLLLPKTKFNKVTIAVVEEELNIE